MSKIQAFDFSIDLMRAILWQYNDAVRLQSLLEQKKAWYDANYKSFWDNWVRDVFDLRTCNDFGLAVWAIILDMPIVVQTDQADPSRPTWGFGSYHRNFRRGNFFNGRSTVQVLSPDEARLALRLRYFQIVSRSTVPEINKVINSIFSNHGPVWVEDNGDMTITYYFGFTPSAQLMLVMQKNDLLPRPSGVSADYLLVDVVYDGARPVFDGISAVIL